MNIDLMVWAPNRESFIKAMLAYNFGFIDENKNLIPRKDVLIDEIGVVVKTPAINDKDGNVIIPAVIVDGHHVNIRVTGDFAKFVTTDKPTEGTVFERTNVLTLIPGLQWEPINQEGVPAGYEGIHGVRLFDPTSVQLPMRVWA